MHKKMYLTECIVHRYVGSQTYGNEKTEVEKDNFLSLIFIV